MVADDELYVLFLLLSLPFGWVVGRCNSVAAGYFNCSLLSRGVITLLFSLLIVSVACFRGHSFLFIPYHMIFVAAGNYILLQLKVFGKSNHLLLTAYPLLYLAFYRSLDINDPDSIGHTLGFPMGLLNALQLICTLRVISYCVDKHKCNEFKCIETADYILADTTIIDYIFYILNPIGILTGPFYPFHIHYNYIYNNSENNQILIPFSMIIKRFLFAIPYALAFVFLTKQFPMKSALVDGIDHFCDDNEYTFIGRLIHLALGGKGVTYRFYCGWFVAETVCLLAGCTNEVEITENKDNILTRKLRDKHGNLLSAETSFLASNVSSTKLNGNSNGDLKKTEIDSSNPNLNKENNKMLIWSKNCDVSIEYATSVRNSFRKWNISVQTWMVKYIYKLFPTMPKSFRTMLVFTVSAFWHGLHSGYYIYFCGAGMSHTVHVTLYINYPCTKHEEKVRIFQNFRILFSCDVSWCFFFFCFSV